VDEKSQIKALDRTQPGLPLNYGTPENSDPWLSALWHHHAVRRTGGGHGSSGVQALRKKYEVSGIL